MSDTQDQDQTEGQTENQTVAVADPAAAPDAVTAVAAAVLAAAKADGKTDDEIADSAKVERDRKLATLAKVKAKYYKAVYGVMIDPETQKEFNTGNGTKSPLTAWLDFQIANGKIVEE